MSVNFGTFNVLGISVTACDAGHILEKIEDSIQTKTSLIIAPIASHPIIEAFFDKKYKKILNSFDYILPDSFYVVLAIRFLYKLRLKSRVYGPELFMDTCQFCLLQKEKILLFGNETEEVKAVLLSKFPGLKIDTYDVTHLNISHNEIEKFKNHIQKSKPSVIAIGIGSPKQHYIIDALRSVPHPILAVGAAFSFVSGSIPQAPLWVGNHGLEWLYRLLREPQRLWKRYIIYGPLFIFLVLKQKIAVNNGDPLNRRY